MATEEPAHVEGKTKKEIISGKNYYSLVEFSFPSPSSFSLDLLSYYVSSLLVVCLFCLSVCFLPPSFHSLFRGFTGRQIHWGHLLTNTVAISN